MTDTSLWPYKEATKIIDRVKDSDKEVIFETGYGPSGLPHIGTFGEVARTNWVRRAFSLLTGKKSRLITFSDDMDALRKTPDNVPNKHILDKAHDLPLSVVPNPFDTAYKSYAEHNNHKLMEFLDSFGLDYEFASSTEYYRSGKFNNALQRMAERHEQICKVVRPTLRGQRAEEWSPFMPIHPLTGKVMTVPILSVNAERGTIVWKDLNGDELMTSIYDGNCKIQWKADWALRWYALGVDYEMSGKDLIDSVKLSSKICRILGGNPPINLTYELFLDQDGHKISKSKGNGLSFEEWLDISTTESLELFMFNNPSRAKKIGTDIAIQTEDEFIKQSNKVFSGEDNNGPVGSFINAHNSYIPITYQLIINIISAASIVNSDEVWSYLTKYNPDIDVDDEYINKIIDNAITYYTKYIVPTKVYSDLTPVEYEAVTRLRDWYMELEDGEKTSEKYQYCAFEVGKQENFNLREWFQILYEFLLGQKTGPRFGNFVDAYGLENTITLMTNRLMTRDDDV